VFILFGTKGRAIETDSGQFHCPNCNIKEEYGKKYVQDWFTLFFIPIFPISGKKNDHIECKKCESIYHTDVIEYKPALNEEEIESEYEKALKNVLCLMILADKKVEEGEISTVSNIYNKLTNDKKFTKNQIDKNIVKLKKDKKTINQYLKKIKPYLNSGHRELIIKAMYFVASSDGHLDKKEGELLMKTANVLEMTSAHVKGVLSELDKKNNN
tara:strand:- start:1375 stop:2013 length:639 start_codon:yes stop_codon:yes gene_type:complete